MPPSSPNSSVGRNCRGGGMRARVGLRVRRRPSQSWAIRCTQVPVLENSWPVANSRKFRVRKELNTELESEWERGEWGRWGLAVAGKDIQFVVVRYVSILVRPLSLTKKISPITVIADRNEKVDHGVRPRVAPDLPGGGAVAQLHPGRGQPRARAAHGQPACPQARGRGGPVAVRPGHPERRANR